jgi:Fic-DOC domain mobile mystery protein B
MGLNLNYLEGQTPLDEEEKNGLRIPTIAIRQELDEFEQQSIEDAMLWVFNKSLNAEIVLTEKFICDLHKRMYGQVWSWAGKFRKTDKNLGIDKWKIPVELRALCDDALFWMINQTFSNDEIALRFKHRLVSIHCFSNGNGRHSRLMADIIISKVLNQPIFSWGSSYLVKEDNVRKAYLKALKSADRGELKPLLLFSRS